MTNALLVPSPTDLDLVCLVLQDTTLPTLVLALVSDVHVVWKQTPTEPSVLCVLLDSSPKMKDSARLALSTSIPPTLEHVVVTLAMVDRK